MPNTAGIFGTVNDASTQTPQTDPNAFNYGGTSGGAAARQNQLSQLGAQGANYSGTQPYQAAQMSALAQAQREANGEDFGATQAQLSQGLAQAQAGAAAQAAGARGGGANLAAAQNQAGNAQAGMAASSANQAAALKAQMQMQGVQNLNNFASGGLGQQAQMAQFNAQNQMGYEGMNNQIGLAQLQAQGNQQQLNSQNQLGAEQLANQQGAGNADRNSGLLSGAAGAVGGAAGAIAGMFSSDERAKESIQGESGGRYMSSPIGAKNGIQGESSWMPGMNNQALGQAQLAAAPSNALHLKGQQNVGMNAWIDQAMAKPWSPQAAAADANVNKVFFSSSVTAKKDMKPEGEEKPKTGAAGAIGAFGDALGGFAAGGAGQHSSDRVPYHEVTSDTRAKKKAVEESALAKAAAEMQADMAGKRNGFEWMRDQPAAVEQSAADQYMETARPYTYDYKNPAENGGERRLGIMAQNLEQGPTGGDLVKDTPRGKVVDVPALASANSAAVGRLHDRVSALEASRPSGDALPAGPVRVASLAPPDDRIYSAYDNATPIGSLRSDARAKQDARAEGFAKGIAAAAPQVVATRRSPYDLPAPPPPPMPDPQADRVARQLAAYNAQADAQLRAAAQGHPASFQPAVASRGVFAQRAR